MYTQKSNKAHFGLWSPDLREQCDKPSLGCGGTNKKPLNLSLEGGEFFLEYTNLEALDLNDFYLSSFTLKEKHLLMLEANVYIFLYP